MICYYVLNSRNLRQIEINEINDLLAMPDVHCHARTYLQVQINNGFNLDQVYWVDTDTALIVTEYANPTAIAKLTTKVQYEIHTRILSLQAKRKVLEVETQVLIAETNGQLSLEI
jgi:hypothetical protein